MNIFINNDESRLRAGWRLLLFFLILSFCAGLFIVSFQYIWQSIKVIAEVIPQFLGAIVSVWIAARLLDKRPIANFGLHINQAWWRDALAGVIIAALAMGTIFILEWSLGWITITGFGWEASRHLSFGETFFTLFIAMLMVGFYEELIFRGYLIKNLAEGFSFITSGNAAATIAAVLISSSIFGLMHGQNPNASVISTFNIVLAGIMLAIPYCLTGSLALSMGLHFSWNFMQGTVLGFPVSGLDAHTSVIQTIQKGSELWTGGAFGPEAGLTGIIGMAIIVVLTYVYLKQVGYELATADSFQKGYQPSAKTDEQAS